MAWTAGRWHALYWDVPHVHAAVFLETVFRLKVPPAEARPWQRPGRHCGPGKYLMLRDLAMPGLYHVPQLDVHKHQVGSTYTWGLQLLPCSQASILARLQSWACHKAASSAAANSAAICDCIVSKPCKR